VGVFVYADEYVCVVDVVEVFETRIEAVYVGLAVDVFEDCRVRVGVRL